MNRLIIAFLILFGLAPAFADGITNPGGSGGGTAGFITCSAGVCTFTGADGSTQMVVGTTNSAVDFLKVVGGVSGAGASMTCQSSTDTNVACNFTAQGTGATTFNNGHGNLATFADPGAAVTGPFTFTPGIGTTPATLSATNGVNIAGNTQTASGSASLNWTGLAGTANFWTIDCSGLIPAAGGNAFIVRFTENNGSSYIATGYNFFGTATPDNAAAAIVPSVSTSATGITISGSQSNSTAALSLSAHIVIYNPNSATLTKQITAIGTGAASGPHYQLNQFGGSYTGDTNAINGAQILVSSGNISSGSCTLRQST